MLVYVQNLGPITGFNVGFTLTWAAIWGFHAP